MAKSAKNAEKEVKKDTKKVKQTKKKEPKKVKESYAKLLKKEMKMVKWPEKKEVLKYTISTIVFCLFVCAFFQALLFLMSIVKGWF